MTAMTLFGGNAKTNALLADIKDDLTDTIAGSSASVNRRISIEGRVFREMVNGREVRTSEENSMNVVMLKAAPISRMYFEGSYVKGKIVKPTCWSLDTQVPDKAVPQEQRQAERCMDCKQNIKGSGTGESKACRLQQRVAIMLEGDIDRREVYQLNLPPTSVFGDAENNKMPLQAYGRFLKAHNTHAISVITEMRFDSASSTPKLVFKAVRPLEEDELRVVLEMRDHPDTTKAVTLTVSQMDNVLPAPAEAPKLTQPKAKPEPVAVSDDEEVAEPKKMTKKTAVVVEDKSDMADIVGEWDD
ncbi:MAG: hypothetical protein EBR82_27055 [Caulobacteraceae bacterium]|nr:hypothetical protein [Caulobacteraceae bacterium]